MAVKSLTVDLEKILGALAGLFSEEGKAREVAVLAMSKASIQQTDYDNWDGGIYGYTIYLEVPPTLYAQLTDQHKEIEDLLKKKAESISRMYDKEWIQSFVISTELVTDDDWREKATAWVTGKGLTNQGRARSDNLAPRMVDGLLFRSQAEIYLYKALKSTGISFAPLPVFVRGGQTYRRIEPDFVLIKDGVLMVVEVDGDTVHRETPAEAHDRITMLAHEGAHIERVKASECDTPERASKCATRLLEILNKHKQNR